MTVQHLQAFSITLWHPQGSAGVLHSSGEFRRVMEGEGEGGSSGEYWGVKESAGECWIVLESAG